VKFKTAQVSPLLKKHGLDVSDPANYWPISNLNTISKILKQLVLLRLVPHVSTSSSFDAIQSVYRRLHSTDTALLKITDDIFASFDNHQSTILVALDQSAAFDCINHKTLVSRLEHTFGVMGSALAWICSYLEARSTFVRWKENSSDVLPLYTGVPQGSSLGPFLFSLYIAPLSAVINSFGVSHHQYADDTHIYVAVSRADVSDKVDLLQDSTVGVHSWLLMNGLQLNPVKSEVIQFTATRGSDKVEEVISVVVSNAIIQPASSI
jgi:Reverse transcriptase (RNA-dependent DNA polymerase)